MHSVKHAHTKGVWAVEKPEYRDSLQFKSIQAQ